MTARRRRQQPLSQIIIILLSRGVQVVCDVEISSVINYILLYSCSPRPPSSVPVGRPALVMVMVVMMSGRLLVVVHRAGCRPRVVHVVDDQLGSVAHALDARRSVGRDILAPAARVMMMVVMVRPRVFGWRGRLVQVLPRLPVVPVQTSPALGTGRVQRGDRVSVRRRPVTVVFGTAIPFH